MQASNRTRNIVSALVIVLVAATLIGATVWTPAKHEPVAAPVAKLGTQASPVGAFTGEFDDGAPVYRLPSITVTASRSAEMARMAQEDQVAGR